MSGAIATAVESAGRWRSESVAFCILFGDQIERTDAGVLQSANGLRTLKVVSGCGEEDVTASGAPHREMQPRDNRERFESDLEAALARSEKEHSKRWNWSWFNDVILKTLTSTAFGLFAAALVILVGVSFIQALWWKTISIQPLSVPKSVAENGFTPDVIASKLRDAIIIMVSRARLTKKYREITQQNELPDIVVPSVGISVQALASQVRSFLGITRRQNITGEFTLQDGVLFLRLHLNRKLFLLIRKAWR